MLSKKEQIVTALVANIFSIPTQIKVNDLDPNEPLLDKDGDRLVDVIVDVSIIIANKIIEKCKDDQ